MRVPASWVSFGYPKHLLILTSHDVRLPAGGTAIIPVTVNVPPGAARGTYVAGLTVSTGTGSGGVQLGAAAEVPLMFTVGISKPHWTARQMAATGNCWSPPGAYESWQQSTGSSDPTPPPGWHWEGGQVNSWAYTPPPGWYDTNTGTGQVYLGGKPVVTCASAALWTRRDGLLDGSYPWLGGKYPAQFPDTSTPAGCAAWLAASAKGTLSIEGYPEGSQSHAEPTPGPLPQRVQTATAMSSSDADVTPWAALCAGAVVIASARWHFRRRRRSGRR
jgi:hypothetical protein